MRKSNIVTMSIIIAFVIGACNWLTGERLPGIDIPLEELNNDLQLSAPPEISTFKIGDNLGLVLVNSSATTVVLPQDYGVYIFQNVDGKWETIENRIDYPPGEKNILPKEGQPFRELIIIVHPIIYSDQPATVRIVVVGNRNNELGGVRKEQVGAFIDVTLKP
jgi:hypothetical protein